MRTVWKKILGPQSSQQVAWPKGSKIVTAGMQGDDMYKATVMMEALVFHIFQKVSA